MDKFETIEKSFNQDFCNELEYHLSHTLRNSTNPEFKFLWCDGIEIPETNQLLIDHILTTKIIVTKAWVGENGQKVYSMTIKLGEVAMKACLSGNKLKVSLPGNTYMDWILINTESNTIELQLN